MQAPSFNRTRIAPTPSGYLHLGNAYSFLLTAQLAREYNARILLRIDDIDRTRMREAYVDDIFDTLSFLEINWDEGPKNAPEFHERFSQHLRLPLYHDLLERLVATGRVYACNCSRKQLAEQGGHDASACRGRRIPLDTPDVAWRIDTDSAGELTVKALDGVQKGRLDKASQHFIIRKRDGYPAYQVASLADDLHFGVGLIVRGEDLWMSTLSQLFLAELLEEKTFLDATFHHHPLLTDSDNRKLSKSEGATSLFFMRTLGYNKSDVQASIEEKVKT